MTATARDLQNLKIVGQTNYNMPKVSWGPQGSSYLVLPMSETPGLGLLIHTFPEGDSIAGTMRIKDNSRILHELSLPHEPGEGSEYKTPDNWLLLHGHASNGENMQFLLTTGFRLFDRGMYVKDGTTSRNGGGIREIGYANKKEFGHFADIVNQWHDRDLRVDKITLDKNRMYQEMPRR